MTYLTCDGAANPNPGRAGIGVALFNDAGEVVATISRMIGDPLSNNVAEYEAALAAFRLAHYDHKIERPDVRTDSMLVVKQATGEWGVMEDSLLPLCRQLQKALRVTGGSIKWIPREENTVADALSKRAIRPAIFPTDPVAIAVVVAEIRAALAALPAREAEIARVSRLAIDAIAERPEDVTDALATLRLGRGVTSTMPEDLARFHAGLLYGKDAVAAMEAALAGRSRATQLKALRWASRGLAPTLVAGKLRIEKALRDPYRVKAGTE